MSDVTSSPVAPEPVLVKQKKPVAGFLWGIVFGLGLSLLAVSLKVIDLAIVPMVVVLVLGIVLAVAWSTLGPAKKAPPTG